MPNATTDAAPQAAVCLPTETCNVVCPQCGKDFEPANRRQRFCGATCRVAAHRENNRALARQFKTERHSAFGMSFDGRFSGALRDVGRNRPNGYAARHRDLVGEFCVTS